MVLMSTPDARTVLVTGATDGLGRAVAEHLAASGATVLLHGRDPGRLRRAADEIRSATGNERVLGYLADLASLDQVRSLAAEIRRDHDRLHVLVSNAGIGSLPAGRQTSADGHELRFAVNYLAGFLLTMELLPLLTVSAPARIVNVASLGQHPIDFDDVMIERGYSASRAYGQGKLAGRLQPGQVTVNSLHPGTYMPTKMVLISREPVDTLETGVDSTARLAASPDLDQVSGR